MPEGQATEREDGDDLPVVRTEIVEFDPVARDLAVLRHQLRGVAYDLTARADEEAARRDRRFCVSLRTRLDDVKAETKADLLKRTRAIDEAYRLIRAAILEVEKPIDDQIKAKERAEEERREAERQAIAARQKAMRAAMLEAFTAASVPPGVKKAAHLRAERERIIAIDTGAAYGDMQPEADDLRSAVLEALTGRITEAEAVEAEQAALAQQRAEQEAERQRLDAERKQREQEDAARRAEEDKRRAEEQARLDAEAKRLADERADFERQQAEQREREAAEQRRKDEEARAEAERKEAAAQEEREAAAAAERQRQAEELRRSEERFERANRVAAQALPMLACLRAWRDADYCVGDSAKREKVQDERDRILDSLEDVEFAPPADA